MSSILSNVEVYVDKRRRWSTYSSTYSWRSRCCSDKRHDNAGLDTGFFSLWERWSTLIETFWKTNVLQAFRKSFQTKSWIFFRKPTLTLKLNNSFLIVDRKVYTTKKENFLLQNFRNLLPQTKREKLKRNLCNIKKIFFQQCLLVVVETFLPFSHTCQFIP